MQSIIKLTRSSITPEYSSIASGAIERPAAITFSLLIDKVGRKPLLVTCPLVCAVALISEGASTTTKRSKTSPKLHLKSLEQLCGYIAVKSNMQSIMKLTRSSITLEYSGIAFGAIEIPAAINSSLLIDKVGRKALLVTSSLVCAVALISEGAYFYLQDKTRQDISHAAWLPTSAIVFYSFVNIGVLNVTMMKPGEIYPSNIKGVAVSFETFSFGMGLSFLVVKFFAPPTEAWGVFWVFAAFCLGAPLVNLVVPETKRRSVDEIQEIINPKACEKTGGDC